jgi:endogenous inhibitor of DNA gyrase (YacG/DUF329 family)
LTLRSSDRYDGAVKPSAPVAKVAHCPRCNTAVLWKGNPHRPFCSLTCRLIDLGVWLEERYRIAGPELADDSGDRDRVPPGAG